MEAFLKGKTMTGNVMESGNEEEPGLSETVARTVFEKFFSELAKIDGFADISSRMHKLVIEEEVFAEPSIRAALFPDAP